MASHSKIPTGKLSRSAVTSLTTAKIGFKHIAYKSKSRLSKTPINLSQQKLHEKQIGQILINAFTQLRGTALKVGQMLSMELNILPSQIRAELAKACHSVTPLNRAHIRKVFAQEFQLSPNEMFQQFNVDAFAAASLGQVHRATSHAGELLAVKIQYPGIAACIQSDLRLVRGILKMLSKTTDLLPKWDIINTALLHIEQGLYEEIDYQQEAINTQWFADYLSLPSIRIPQVKPEQSSQQILTTQLLDGLHLDAWLATQPSQQQRDDYGQLLMDLFFHQLLTLKKIHADPHQGNFLFCQNGQLGLIDFGCVRTLDADFPEIVMGLFSQDTQQLFTTYHQLGMFDPSLRYTEFTQEFFPAIQPFQHWLSTPFSQPQFDFSTMPPMPKNDFQAMKKTVQKFHDIHCDQLYFDRFYFGLLSMLRSLGATVKTRKAFNH